MVVYEQFNAKQIRAYSDSNKFLNEYDRYGNLLVEGKYIEAINDGIMIGEKIGQFNNGNFYLESEKDIPIFNLDELGEVEVNYE